MSVAFLSVGSDTAVARSPMERLAREAGAQFELVDGWNVATVYTDSAAESAAPAGAATWTDVSHRPKLELRGSPEDLERAASAAGVALTLGHAAQGADALWCRLAADHLLIVGADAAVRDGPARVIETVRGAARVTDVTCVYAAITLAGPAARDAIARFSALDLRPSRAPVGAVRPGSLARQPGILICEAADRYLILFGWSIAEYVWETVADAVTQLGGRPAGRLALRQLAAAEEENRNA